MTPFNRRTVASAVALAIAAMCAPAAAQSVEAARSAARKALQSNPEVTARLNAYLSKIDAQTAAAAARMPRVDVGADIGTGRSQTANTTSTTVNRAGANLSVSQLLWDGMATRNEVNRTGHERLNRWFELVDTSEQIALEATRAVYDVQRQRRLLALAEDNLTQHQQAAAKLESRFKAGVGRGVDLDQARARLALAESNRDTELSNLHDVAARYQRIVGEMPPADMGSIEMLRQGQPASAEEAARVAVQRSAAIAAAIEGVRAARAAEASSRSALQPQVSARAQVGGGQNYGGVVDRKSDASIGVVMNWNIFDGGGDRARISEKQKLVQQSMDLRDKACRDVRQTVLIAQNDAAKLAAQVATLGRNTVAIERARDAYRQQFEIGQRSLLDLLNAESESYTARRALTNAVFDRATAHARTLAATTQLTTQLGIARDLMPPEASNWSADADGAARCPTGGVDVTALRPTPEQAAAFGALVEPTPAAAPAPAPLAAATPAARATPSAVPPPAQPRAVALAPAAARGERAPASAAARVAPAAVAAAAVAAEPLTAAKAASVPLATSIGQQMDAWAQAWRRGDSNSLSNLYAPGFKGNPAQNPLWKRRPSKNDPIDLEIEDVNAKELVNGTVETRFQQSVITLDGVEVGEVVLTWQQLNGRWRIVRERRV